MKRLFAGLALSASLALSPALALACDGEDEAAPTADAKPAPAGAQTVAYTVDGMHCEGCAGKVASAVRKLPGVYTVAVDIKTKVAKVAFDQKKVSPEQIKAAISKAGFKPGTVA